MSVNEYIWLAIQKEMHSIDVLQTMDISNRRYVGSKRALVPFIRSSLKNIRFNSFADIFAGTGVVASSYNSRKRIVTNDILYSNYISHFAWFSDSTYDEAKIREILIRYNSMATQYFTVQNKSLITKNDCFCAKLVNKKSPGY